MKTLKLVTVILALLFAVQVNTHAQNWGFSLPFGSGGFAINGKNWTAGYGGAVVGGGRSGWGFQLPNGSGFYNGGGGGAPYFGGGCSAPPPQQGYFVNQSGWSYGPVYCPVPSSTRPARYIAARPNGEAVWQAEDGTMWHQNPF